jgi:AcrR family transcriptional regulator
VSYRYSPAETRAAGPAPAAPRPGRPRDDERERAILDAVAALVAEVGYDRMSMDAVASRARASKATIYRRWPGKAELVVDAVQQLVGEKVVAERTGALRTDLLALLRTMRSHMQGQAGDLMVGLALAARRDPDLAAAIRAQFTQAKLCPTTAELVAGAVARGELPADADSQLLDELLPALLLFRQFQGEETDDAYLDRVVDDVLLPVLDRHR